MKTYVLVGVSKINYTDKKDGNPRTLTRLHFTYEDAAEKSLIGSGVMSEVVPDRVFQDNSYEPDYRGNARLAMIQPL